MRSIALCISILFTTALQAQIPSYGSANQLDVACWNIKWFGDLNNGPSDETMQFNNALKVFRETNVDVWGLSEISDDATFSRMIDSLSGYQGIIAPINQSQKTALMYDTSLFTVLFNKLVITDKSYDFASGRFPFEVAMVPKYGNPNDTLIIIVLHLKANVGNASDKQKSWERRKNAAGHLKTYISQTHSTKKVVVLGDFNDDTDVSIYSPNPTPFDTLLNDASNYKFLTIGLSASNTGSTVGRTDMIDHQMVSDELFNAYIANSCKIMPLQNYITSYSSTTSDHYPVTASYNYQFVGIDQPSTISLFIYPNPLKFNEKLKIENGKLIGVFDLNGKELNPDLFLNVNAIRKPGVYAIQIELKGSVYHRKLLVQ